MTIVAECPHCETRYNVRPDLRGKKMRCPNRDCGEVFVVPGSAGKPSPPPPLELEFADEPKPPPPLELEFASDAPPPRPAVKPPVKPPVKRPPKPPAPPPKPTAPPPVEVDYADEPEPPPVVREWVDDEPPPARKKPRKTARLWLAGLITVVVALLAGGGYGLYRMTALGEAQRAKQADNAFAAGQYQAAARQFLALADEYPDGSNAGRYRFFADLSAVEVVVRPATARDDPAAVLGKFTTFLDAHRDSPLAKPTTGHGRDVLDAGRKLADDFAGHADDRVKAYRGDRSKPDELSKADAAVATGRGLVDRLAPFRGPDDPPLDGVRAEFDKVEAAVRAERDRSAVIAAVRARLDRPSAAGVDAAVAQLTGAGLGSDPDAQELIRAAKAQLRGDIKFVPDPAAPVAVPPSTGGGFLFATPVGKDDAPAGRTDPAGVFLATSRGVMYALDEATGSLLWAHRVGTGAADPPARFTADDGAGEVALIASAGDTTAGLTARRVRTGEPLWHQPLPAPAAGPAVVVGRRAYQPVRDDKGSVVEFDLTNGHRVGSLAVGQPVGVAAARRPGTGLIDVPADGRRVFVLDAASRDDDGKRLPLRCVRVIATGHDAGTLRAAPLVTGSADPDSPRTLVLCQADGPGTMKLRAFSLVEGPPAATGPAEVAPPSTDLTVPGWTWFPPAADGDRVAVATDAGRFRLFGLNQPGNADRDLFPIAPPKDDPPADGDPVPGTVIPIDGRTFGVLAGGLFRRVRLGLDPARGEVLHDLGPPVPLGAATGPAVVNGRRDTAFVVVRPPHATGGRAVAIDLADGHVRWSRRLGFAPAAPPISQTGGTLLVDEDGGLAVVPPAAVESAPVGDRPADPAWAVAPAFADATGPTVVAGGADGSPVWTVTPRGTDAAPRFAVRRIAEGKVTFEATDVTAPAGLAGKPVPFGDGLLLAASDGLVYLFDPTSKRLVPGPTWRAGRVGADATCFLAAPAGGREFLATDGERGLGRWAWPTGGEWSRVGVRVEMRERIAVPPLPGTDLTRVFVADVTGSVWLIATDGGDVVRRWRSGGANPLPAGPPTAAPVVRQGADGRPRVAITAGRSVVVLDPEKDAPIWSATVTDDRPGVEFVGGPVPTPDGWLVVENGGRSVRINGDTGRPSGDVRFDHPGTVPSTAAAVVGPRTVMVPLSDGTVAVAEMKRD